jgi:hypothetical protein
MEDKERSIQIGDSRIHLSEDNIIYATPKGDIDEITAIELRENIIKLANMVDGRVNSVIDLNKIGRPSIRARMIGKDAFEHEKVGKVAFYGLHPVAKMLASFAMGAARNNDMRFFKTKEEALDWMKE